LVSTPGEERNFNLIPEVANSPNWLNKKASLTAQELYLMFPQVPLGSTSSRHTHFSLPKPFVTTNK